MTFTSIRAVDTSDVRASSLFRKRFNALRGLYDDHGTEEGRKGVLWLDDGNLFQSNQIWSGLSLHYNLIRGNLPVPLC